MQTELLDGRRLRFPIELGESESIPGAIVRGVRQHVLVRTAPVLEAASVELRHVGMAQIATAEELERLAFVVRCSATDLVDRGGQRLVDQKHSKSFSSKFGRLVIPRAYIEFQRRRIGPITLRDHDYHRASWMNLLLPYCPISLERLVDRCGHCDKELGWFHANGVGHCDRCELAIEPSPESALPNALADEYRLFALLSSPDARGVEAAYAKLPISLSHTSPGSLVRLALHLGGLVQPEPVVTAAQNVVRSLPAPVLATVSCAGTALLRSWPDGFRKWIAAQTEELRGRPADLTTLRGRLKRVADRSQESADLVTLMVDAVPDLHQHAAHGFATDRPYYLYKYVQNTLGLSSPKMTTLKKWTGLKFLKLNTAAKEQGQFDVEQIDELVPVFRDSELANACFDTFELPLYAIEQLCAANLLEWEDHPALLAMGGAPKIRGASIRKLRERLLEMALQGTRSDDAIPLSLASRRIGGRLKPWAAIIKALVEGNLAFWREGDGVTVSSLFVTALDIAKFDTVIDADTPPDYPASTTVTQRDAAEILNTETKYLPGLSTALGLKFVRSGMGLAVSRNTVLAAAMEVAWSPEIALHLNQHPRAVSRTLTSLGINPCSSGWGRRYLISKGILPEVPGFGGKNAQGLFHADAE